MENKVKIEETMIMFSKQELETILVSLAERMINIKSGLKTLNGLQGEYPVYERAFRRADALYTKLNAVCLLRGLR